MKPLRLKDFRYCLISVLDTEYFLLFSFIYYVFSVSELNFIIYLFTYLFFFYLEMNVSDALWSAAQEKCPKKREKKPSEECLSVFFLWLFLPSIFPDFPFSEGGSTYCILSVECVCFNSSKLAKKKKSVIVFLKSSRLHYINTVKATV